MRNILLNNCNDLRKSTYDMQIKFEKIYIYIGLKIGISLYDVQSHFEIVRVRQTAGSGSYWFQEPFLFS